MLAIALLFGVLAAAARVDGVPERPGVSEQTALLAGHVVYDTGEPCRAAFVNATKWRMVAGKRRFVESSSVTVDADGYFLIADISPGTYTIEATPNDTPGATGGTMAYQPESIAGTIELAEGAAVRNLTITLFHRARTFGVSGTAVNALTGKPVPDAQFVLLPAGEDLHGSHSARVKQGVFRFTNVRPGTYRILTNPDGLTPDGKGGYRRVGLYGTALIVVGEGDVSGVNVQLTPGSKLMARFRGGAVSGAALSLMPLDAPGTVLGKQAAADGTLEMPGVPPGRYRLHVTAPAGTYVASVQADGTAVQHTLEINDEHDVSVEILLSRNAGEISGRVADAGAGLAVMLWAPQNSEPRSTITDDDGTFRFGNLGPGDYRVLASEEAGYISPDDASMWQALERRAAVVRLGEGAKVSVALNETNIQ